MLVPASTGAQDGVEIEAGEIAPQIDDARLDYDRREIMDALSVYSDVQRIVFQGGRQIAKSEIGLNWIGYVIHHAPGPMLLVEPSVDMAKKTSRQRITPMLEASSHAITMIMTIGRDMPAMAVSQ